VGSDGDPDGDASLYSGSVPRLDARGAAVKQLPTILVAVALAGMAGFGARALRLALVPEAALPSGAAAETAAGPAGTQEAAADPGHEARGPAAGAAAPPANRSTAAASRSPDASANPFLPRATASRRGGSFAVAEPGEPIVANVLAREALRAVGKDPAALVIWLRAINDPAMPEGDRSDLIEDLNDEGYDDLGSYTEADLQLILARLELIEQQMPLAKDAVNAWAFTEAYQDLLGMLGKARADVAAARKR
jgi:hypothetical protein